MGALSTPKIALKRINEWSRTVFGKITLILCLLLLLLAGFQVLLTFRVWNQSLVSAEQQLYWNTAPFLAGQLERSSATSTNLGQMQRIVEEFCRANPKASVFLLDDDGTVLQAFLSDGGGFGTASISLAPVRRFLESSAKAAPILGDDPRNPKEKAIFSAARLTIGDRPLILYILFSTESWRNIAMVDYEDAIVMTVVFWSFLSLIATAIVGAFLFRLLTKRLSKITATVNYFHAGDFSKRIGFSPDDELGILGSTIDEMAEQIESAISALRERDLLRRELIANVSHDLRGPLTNIRGNVEELDRLGTKLDPRYIQEFLDTVKRNIGYLSELLSQLFELAKLEAQEVKPEFEEFPIDQLVDDLVISYHGRAKSAGITLTAEIDYRPLITVGDIRMLDRVLMNLLENALKFTPTGGIIAVKVALHGDVVRVSIADSGTGIAPEDVPRVLEKFYQGSGATRAKGSTGLGLAIVERLLQLNSSSIRFDTALNRGTTFFFDLPLRTMDKSARG